MTVTIAYSDSRTGEPHGKECQAQYVCGVLHVDDLWFAAYAPKAITVDTYHTYYLRNRDVFGNIHYSTAHGKRKLTLDAGRG